jgi:predicted RNA-binding protein with PUA-like domain
MAGKYWLFKSEPGAYSFDDLVADDIAEWDGVRNFQVRNWLRDDIKPGDGVLFYHSSTKVIGVVGTALVMREGYPDDTAWNPGSEHPDPKSTPEKPIWYMVDIKAQVRFADTVTPDEMKTVPELADMMVLKRGNRFSISPVTQAEFEMVVKLGEAK